MLAKVAARSASPDQALEGLDAIGAAVAHGLLRRVACDAPSGWVPAPSAGCVP